MRAGGPRAHHRCAPLGGGAGGGGACRWERAAVEGKCVQGKAACCLPVRLPEWELLGK